MAKFGVYSNDQNNALNVSSIKQALRSVFATLSYVGGSEFTKSYKGEIPAYRTNVEYWGPDYTQSGSLTFSRIEQEDFIDEIYTASPKKLTKKFLAMDNHIEYMMDTTYRDLSGLVDDGVIATFPDVAESFMIKAGKGDDIIEFDGGAKNTTIAAGKGNDIITMYSYYYPDSGNVANPMLIGGKGKDTFVYKHGFGTIKDYKPGKDSVSINGETDFYMQNELTGFVNGDGLFYLLDRQSMEPLFAFEGLTSIDQITFIEVSGY